ncbi:type VI secretion system baseplate subunit TssE [Botrimarina sp.]|uniref:type VI secretion system baseplate subunit TssE n=1 Tax=Botrimarina sp. TaxID=2795802 RepID=UPI0032EC7C22
MPATLGPSLLDRLLDASAGVAEPGPARLERIIDDLEDLLNTCCVPSADAAGLPPGAADSIVAYGAPAPQSLAIATHAERLATADTLRRVIQRFEPRLERVRVRVEEPHSRSAAGRFTVQARLATGGELSLPIRVRNTSGRTQVTAERP